MEECVARMMQTPHTSSGRCLPQAYLDPKRSAEADVSFAAVDQQLATLWPASVRSYRPRAVLIQQGDHIEHIYLLIRGMVKFSFVDGSGRELISVVRSGACTLGADAALLGVSSFVAATTLTPCRIRLIPAGPIRKLLRNDAGLSFHMSRLIAFESLSHAMALIDAGSGDARDRLIKFLRQGHGALDDTSHAWASPAMVLKKHEIAKLLAITPEHLSRIVRQLTREGILKGNHRTLALRRPHIDT
jgi:CRP-like cAMP-binding protein